MKFGFSGGSFAAANLSRRNEGRVERPWVVEGHSGRKSLMVECVAGYRTELSATLVSDSVSGVDGVRSRP